jgi:hypothetical protein
MDKKALEVCVTVLVQVIPGMGWKFSFRMKGHWMSCLSNKIAGRQIQNVQNILRRRQPHFRNSVKCVHCAAINSAFIN